VKGRRAGYFTAPQETRGLPIGQRMPVHTERPAEGDIVSLPALGGLGSLRRECLDHILVLDDRHFHRVVTEYVRYDIGASLRGPAGDPARTPLRGSPVLSNLSTVRPRIRRDVTRRTGLFEPFLTGIRRVFAIPASQLS
jgi:hypothetical protein